MPGPSHSRNNGLTLPVFSGLLSPADYEKMYPPRDLAPGAFVTRFAPSPTGFMHIGGIFISLINYKLAQQSGGVFFLRNEDTDALRAKDGALQTVVEGLTRFNLKASEGAITFIDGVPREVGNYGPYSQTARAKIYHAFVADLIAKGLAYPCFCTEAELEQMRKEQAAQKVKLGYYGSWARWRDAAKEEVEAQLAQQKPYVVRLRSPGSDSKRVTWQDEIKGKMSMPENDQDIVLLKSDGIPTYHLAHVIDDYLMRTTHVIRADEWLVSTPIHLQLFDVLGLKAPIYGHIAPIEKIENQSRRKLSKRKDPEANIDFYEKAGIPPEAILEYLANLIDPSFETWRKANPDLHFDEFTFSLSRLQKHGALGDIKKIISISKELISRMSIEQIFTKTTAWAEKYDPDFAKALHVDPDYTKKVLAVERDLPQGTKRISAWPDVKTHFGFFFDSYFNRATPAAAEQEILKAFAASYDQRLSRDEWFQSLKNLAVTLGYAASVKEFKAEPEKFKGHIGDLAMIIRVALTGARESPDLWEVLRILGPERVAQRLS